MKYLVPNPNRFNMVELPKGNYSGPWAPGPLRNLEISQWESVDSSGRQMSIATATSTRSEAYLEFSFQSNTIVVLQEHQL